MVENSPQTSRAWIKILGRVQGVYFRASAAQEAQNRRLVGWVRNCPDGAVELVAEGAKDDLDKLIDWCHRGPSGARVTEVKVRWEAPEKTFRGFIIMR